MKYVVSSVLLAAVVGTGCYGGSSVPAPATRPETFAVAGPDAPVVVRQGEQEQVKVRLDRGGDFRRSVRLVARPPKGLQVEVAPKVVGPTDPGEVTLTIKTYPDTEVGEHTFRLEATPDASRSTFLEVRVSVAAGQYK